MKNVIDFNSMATNQTEIISTNEYSAIAGVNKEDLEVFVKSMKQKMAEAHRDQISIGTFALRMFV